MSDLVTLQILNWSAGSSPPDRSWQSPAFKLPGAGLGGFYQILRRVSLTAGISGVLRYLNAEGDLLVLDLSRLINPLVDNRRERRLDIMEVTLVIRSAFKRSLLTCSFKAVSIPSPIIFRGFGSCCAFTGKTVRIDLIFRITINPSGKYRVLIFSYSTWFRNRSR